MTDTKVHTRYRLKNNRIVPGVTTVLALLAKPALIHWAWKLGLDGEDYRKVKGKAANIGTITHYLVECDMKDREPELGDYKPNDVEQARRAFQGYLDWKRQYKLIPLEVEYGVVSEDWEYGGTLDCVALDTDGALVLLDVKTSKGIYDEMKYQLAAYWEAWNEMNPGRTIKWAAILRLDKLTGGFSFHPYPGPLTTEFEIFKCLRTVYALRKADDRNRDGDRAYKRSKNL